MLPEHIVDVPVLPPGAPADDVVAADVGAGELTELGLPLPLQPRQGAFSGSSLSCIERIYQRWPMRASSSAPSGMGGMA
jgi:hypothetical protein